MFRSHKTRLALSALAGLALTPALLSAQEARDTVRLDEIVVTAARVATPRAATTASVTVLSGTELRERGTTHVLDALRAVPGVSVVQNGSFGATASLFLRGGQSDYVQILVDGVPLNEPGGRADLSNLTTDNIERIEIVRGPTSVLYGSDAVAGVIQIFTREGREAPRLSASVRGGSYGSMGYNAELAGAGNGTRYAFAASRFSTDGIYADGNGYRNATLSGKVSLAPDARTDLTLSLRYSDGKYHYPTGSDGRLVPGQDAYQLEERTMLGLEIGRFFTDRLEGRLLVTQGTTNGGTDDKVYDPAADTLISSTRVQDALVRQGVDARMNLHLARGTVLTAGVALEGQHQRNATESFSAVWGPYNSSSDPDRTNRGYYLQLLAEPAQDLSLQAGARLDDNDAFGTFTTYRAGASYRLPLGTRLRAAVGTAFKEPSFYQNYSAIGNPDLHPEESRSWEAGLEQAFFQGRLTLSGTYFDQRFRNMIQYRGTPPSPTDPYYFNIARADAAGLELEARLEPIARLALSAGYTHLDTKVRQSGDDLDAEFAEGERLIRRPPHSGTVGVNYRWPGVGALDLTLLVTGKRDDLDFATWPANRVTLERYTRLDLGTEFVLLRAGARRPALTGTLRVENLFDTDYQEIAGFQARGRTILIGARTSVGL